MERDCGRFYCSEFCANSENILSQPPPRRSLESISTGNICSGSNGSWRYESNTPPKPTGTPNVPAYKGSPQRSNSAGLTAG